MDATGATAGGKPVTFPQYLLLNAKRFADRPAMRMKDYGIWQTWTWSEQRDEIRNLALGLKAMGLGEGDRIAIVGSNRPRLYWAFCAAQSLKAIPVPVYADSVAEEMAYVLNHAGVRFAVVQDQEQVDKLQSMAEDISGLTDIIYDEPRGLRDYDHARLHKFDAVQDKGRALAQSDSGAIADWEAGIRASDGREVSAILYTSGTTGRSKGVMLTAATSVKAAEDTAKFDNMTEFDEVLAYLPLAWVGDHYLNYAQGYAVGLCMSCPESPDTVSQNLREIGPTFYFAPPRVFEGLLTSVMIRMEDASRIKKWLFDHYLAVAKKYGEKILEGRPVPLSGRVSYWLGDKLIYGPLRNVLGFTRIRTAYTAGEAIGPDLFSFFRSLGINLKQLYGQTEAFLYVTAQKDGDVRPDTVGPAAPDVEIRIADNGEVQFRSPGMFAGYYGDDEKTRETMTSDGWVMTGDAGIFDAEGHLKIIDRAKDVGKLTTGALYAPKYIENKLKFFPNIKEAVAFGDGRDFVAVFLNIDLTAVGNWAERNNISYASYQELANLPQVYEMMAKHIDQVNRDLAAEPMMAGAQIQRFLVLHKELEADDGELTRTQKVRRGFIAERFGPLIDALYNGAEEQFIETDMTFEDGRKGAIRATVKLADAKVYPVAAELPEAAE
ncbi:Long-chain acyl-CoA synthetase (AMP-forming) [Hoeflea phototrophica DFL-43]|uniref:Long-chain acyl-CoA synthetase (AMP-forming) n=1 Tax=Hoeflea phototrophica (strain DSM 17068 / NCIMB 14078 / DFL-43) TaxID=411684 RepID=A9DC45_HOEPD|nr:AMP-binding protein [Hoeflea phototrophica]EDQ32355.1 Long-chain acyl-CoA synthetase (AMP-forming) [Hoeflea phototrophica DFL-43]